MPTIAPIQPGTGLCQYDTPEVWCRRPKAEAARICRNCPIIVACATNALESGVTDGMWASVWLPGTRSAKPLAAARDQLHAVVTDYSQRSPAAQDRCLELHRALHFAAQRSRSPRSSKPLREAS